MKKKVRKMGWAGQFVLVMICVLAASCGGGGGSSSSSGGGGGTDVEGLEIASQMSLVEASDSTSASRSALGRTLKKMALLTEPSGGDYTSDAAEVDIYTYDESMEFLNEINMILCMMDQTQYSEFVNAGPYIAQVDVDVCDKDQSDEQSNESEVEAVELETWVIDVERDDDSSDQTVKIWVDLPNEAILIAGKLVIKEAQSDSNPFGKFRLDATETTYDGQPVFSMVIDIAETDVGDISMDMQMSFDEDGMSFEQGVKANFLAAHDLQQGVAHIDRTFSGSFDDGGDEEGEDAGEGEDGEDFDEAAEGGLDEESTVIDIAFNETHYLADITEEGVTRALCKSREEVTNRALEYNLYTVDGDRVDLNGGQPVHPAGGNDYDWCWSDSWGVWCPPHISVVSGLQVTDDAGNVYTVFTSNYRLKRHERHTIALEELNGKPFRYWDEDEMITFIAEWDSATEVFMLTATEDCGEMGCQLTEITPTALTIDVDRWYNLWADDFGSLGFVGTSAGLDNSFSATYYTDDEVRLGDAEFASGDFKVNCYEFCPGANLTAAQWEQGSTAIAQASRETLSNPYQYTVDSDTLAITLGGSPACLAEGESPAEGLGDNWWGFSTGSMVTPAVAATLSDVWDVYDQSVHYSFECGPQDWNHTTVLLDSAGTLVEYDDPIRCELDHVDFGKTFLDYQGRGNLHGIPWVNETNDASDFEIWFPLYSLDDGTELSCDGGYGTLVTRAMVIEQTLNELPAVECGSLQTGNIGATDLTYADPDIGDMPSVTDAPKVVQGVIQ